MSDEGIVKYTCERVEAPAVFFPGFAELNECRARLRQMGLIGVYPNGIGYGNVSLRPANDLRFFIAGSATGEIAETGPEHYAKVVDFDFERNWVRCGGPIQASSEAMTHAAIYVADPEARAVLHVHDAALWYRLLDLVPTTSRDAPYGTPAMAREIGRLFRETDVRERRIIAMAGHEDGIVTFGPTIAIAMEVLLDAYSGRPSQ
ncbi:MAG TPA: class II aldolase/adducin family protein [Chthoniobacteraceae bacterium]